MTQIYFIVADVEMFDRYQMSRSGGQMAPLQLLSPEEICKMCPLINPEGVSVVKQKLNWYY